MKPRREKKMGNVKKATSNEDLKKIIMAAVLGGAGAAGIGALVRDANARKNRKKLKDIAGSRNAIIVSVKKQKFMEGLPTPDELSAMRGENVAGEDKGLLPDKHTVSMLTGPGSQDASSMSQEEIDARKKDILRSRSRGLNFFKRGADESKNDDASEGKGKDNSVDGDSAKSDSEEKEDGDKKPRIVLRNQKGEFVSPTDPVGVVQVQKIAQDGYDWSSGVANAVFHPFDTMKKVWDAATDKPVALTAGMVGSLYIAAQIADAINERRRSKSKKRLDEARERYVDLLQRSNGEKTAEDKDITVPAGMAIGSAFFIPMALTALVTNKIIENRKAEKKKLKERSDSYPDEPIILYKTSEDKEIELEPETALALILVKKAMIEDVERLEAERGLAKRAGFWSPWDAAKTIYHTGKDLATSYNSATQGDAVNTAIGIFNDPKNHGLMLDLTKAYASNDPNQINDAYRNLEANVYVPNKWKTWWTGQDKIIKSPEFRATLAQNGRFQDALAYNMNNDPDFKKVRDSMIDDYLGLTFDKNGFLHKILSWIAKNTGIGSYFVNKSMRERHNNMAQHQQETVNNQAANQNNSNVQPAAAQTTAPDVSTPFSSPEGEMKWLDAVSGMGTPAKSTGTQPTASEP